MEAMKLWNDRRNRNHGLLPQLNPTVGVESSGDPMNWKPTPTVNIANIQRGMVNQYQPNRAIWVSYEEIGRRIADGLCLRCGGRGHRIKDCRLFPAHNLNCQGKSTPSISKVSATSVAIEQKLDKSGNV